LEFNASHGANLGSTPSPATHKKKGQTTSA
jgi:hypothetical protein